MWEQFGVPLPRPGDRPFGAQSGDPDVSAHMGWARVQRTDYGIYTGFREAARRSYEALKDGHSTEAMFYPMAACYRHFIELTTKEIIREGAELGIGQFDPKKIATHDLVSLWTRARAVVEQIMSPGEPSDLSVIDAAEQIVADYAALDPTGQEFRYIMDKKGDPQLVSAPSQVNLQQLHDVSERVCEFFECVLSAISAEFAPRGVREEL